jgi:hypothetical protein
MVDSPMESKPLASSLLSILSRRCWLGRSELGLSQLTRVMVAVGEKMGAEVERENSGDVCGPACRGGVGKGAKKRVSLPVFCGILLKFIRTRFFGFLLIASRFL